jgi:hypothetical protein
MDKEEKYPLHGYLRSGHAIFLIGSTAKAGSFDRVHVSPHEAQAPVGFSLLFLSFHLLRSVWDFTIDRSR